LLGRVKGGKDPAGYWFLCCWLDVSREVSAIFFYVALVSTLHFGFVLYFSFGRLRFLGVSRWFWVCGFFWKGCSDCHVVLGVFLGWDAFGAGLGE